MDKLKQTLSRNKNSSGSSEATGTTTRGTGQGSHFQSAKMGASDNLGSTITSQQDTGSADTRANPTAAMGTTGPEAGGSGHIGTVSGDTQGTSTAAVGQTTTYSSHQLGKGDPTGSIADPQSAEPITYQKPETATIGDQGVPQGSAETAATRAFEKLPGMPGGYPGADYTNPYKAENLDPRVDSLPIRSKNDTSSSTATAATGTALGGVALGGAAASTSRSTTDHATPATSNLTSTADPSDRLATYSEAENTRIPDATASGTTGQDSQTSGFVGRALTAVGLGGAAGAAGAAYAGREKSDSAIADTTPSGAARGASHSRKESIPTTAYPAGVDSPRPIAPPVGGTREAATSSSVDRDQTRGIGAGTAAAAGVGAGAAAAGVHHEVTKSSEYPAASATETTLRQDNTAKLRDDLASQPSGISSEAKARATGPEDATRSDHTGRDAALAGAGGAALGGAGVYAATHGHGEQKEFGHTAILGPDTSGSSTQPQTGSLSQAAPRSTQGGTAGLASDPNAKDDGHTKRDAALVGATGAGAVGAGAYGAHEVSNKRAEEDAARQHTPAEKADKKHQKEIEKEEKKHQKDVAAVEKQQTEQEKTPQEELQAYEAERRRRAEAEAAAGVTAVGVGGGAAAGFKNEVDYPEKTDKEKKPGLLKRIFRRKNKDTGEDEEYEAEEEEGSGRHGEEVVVPAALGAGAAYGAYSHHDKKEHDASNIGTAHTTDSTREPQSRYEEVSGGAVKPSYNPLSKDPLGGKDDLHSDTAAAAAGTTVAGGTAAGTTATRTEDTTPAVGTTSSTTAPEQVTTNPTAAATAEKALRDDDGRERHIEPTLGIPYDPAKDPEAAKRLDESSAQHLADESQQAPEWREGYDDDDNNDPSSPSVSSGKKGFRQKLKEKLTGHKDEPEEDHGAEHGVLHKKTHQVPDDASR